MGHQGQNDGSWALNNPQAQIDCAYRGVHVTSQMAKAVITRVARYDGTGSVEGRRELRPLHPADPRVDAGSASCRGRRRSSRADGGGRRFSRRVRIFR
jgi:hypothetical protein